MLTHFFPEFAANTSREASCGPRLSSRRLRLSDVQTTLDEEEEEEEEGIWNLEFRIFFFVACPIDVASDVALR